MWSNEPAVAPRTRRPWRYAVYGAWVAAVFWAVPVTAQTRTATIRVNVTVRGVAESDVLGVRDVLPTDATDDAAQLADGTWRIMAGRAPEMAVQVDAGPAARRTQPDRSVAICEVGANAAAACRHEHAMTLRMDAAHPGYLVRVDRGTGPVRVTLSYVGM